MNPTGMQAAIIRAMMQQQANKENPSQPSMDRAIAQSSAEAMTGSPDKTPVNVSELRTDWNKYIDWLDKKGLKGSPELDKTGEKYFNQYIKENPSTTLNMKYMPIIRAELETYRDNVINNFKAGRAQFPTYSKYGSSEEAEKAFMAPIVKNKLSARPDFPGQHLTQHIFPSYLGDHPVDYNQYNPDYKISDYDNAKDKPAFLKNLYKAYYDSPEYINKYGGKVDPNALKDAGKYAGWVETDALTNKIRSQQQQQSNQ